ncbi:Coproporphyrinogen-III oxidase [Nowakowskiella sp. JEL0078]|nr:Coproporphyrinogen-III oxidase [Nowakowskiella sp. JEL0078]
MENTVACEKAPKSDPMRLKMENFIRNLQKEIVSAIEEVEGSDGARFKQDEWIRPEGGLGLSCVLQDGKVFEKAGVGVSVVHGPLPSKMYEQMRARKIDGMGEGPYAMFAAGISLVMHPHNPNAPTVHLNYRYFELSDPENPDSKPITWWFGGGCDLTPSYLFPEDAEHFHKVIKEACDRHDKSYYPKFKKWCDDYFFIPHRGESRGVGGIFFDDLDDKDPNELFAFVKDCGRSFVKQYVPIMQKRKDMPFTHDMKKWQQLRRGRYAEFNLVYDRGTKFGLATPGARIESILMSLPLTARWEYMHNTEKGSREEQLLDILKKPREWVKKSILIFKIGKIKRNCKFLAKSDTLVTSSCGANCSHELFLKFAKKDESAQHHYNFDLSDFWLAIRLACMNVAYQYEYVFPFEGFATCALLIKFFSKSNTTLYRLLVFGKHIILNIGAFIQLILTIFYFRSSVTSTPVNGAASVVQNISAIFVLSALLQATVLIVGLMRFRFVYSFEVKFIRLISFLVMFGIIAVIITGIFGCVVLSMNIMSLATVNIIAGIAVIYCAAMDVLLSVCFLCVIRS